MEESSLIILVLLIILLYLYYSPNRSSNQESFRSIRRSLDPDVYFEGFRAGPTFPTAINRDVELNTEKALKGDSHYFIAQRDLSDPNRSAPKKIKVAEASGYNMKWKYLSAKYDDNVRITMYAEDPNITLRVPFDLNNGGIIGDLQAFANDNGFSNNSNIWLEIQ